MKKKGKKQNTIPFLKFLMIITAIWGGIMIYYTIKGFIISQDLILLIGLKGTLFMHLANIVWTTILVLVTTYLWQRTR